MTCWDDVVFFADNGIISSLLWFFHHGVELLDSGHVGGEHLVRERRILAYTNIFAFLYKIKTTCPFPKHLHRYFYTLPPVSDISPLGTEDPAHRTGTPAAYWGCQLCYLKTLIVAPQISPWGSGCVFVGFFWFLYFLCCRVRIRLLWSESLLGLCMRYTISHFRCLPRIWYSHQSPAPLSTGLSPSTTSHKATSAESRRSHLYVWSSRIASWFSPL